MSQSLAGRGWALAAGLYWLAGIPSRLLGHVILPGRGVVYCGAGARCVCVCVLTDAACSPCPSPCSPSTPQYAWGIPTLLSRHTPQLLRSRGLTPDLAERLLTVSSLSVPLWLPALIANDCVVLQPFVRYAGPCCLSPQP